MRNPTGEMRNLTGEMNNHTKMKNHTEVMMAGPVLPHHEARHGKGRHHLMESMQADPYLMVDMRDDQAPRPWRPMEAHPSTVFITVIESKCAVPDATKPSDVFTLL